MKLVIAGSREIADYKLIDWGVSGIVDERITQIVSGRTKGVDLLGEQYAIKHNINVKPFPITKEDWEKYGKKAGMIRNKVMADYCDAAITFWDGKSPGTRGMNSLMQKYLVSEYDFSKWGVIIKYFRK